MNSMGQTVSKYNYSVLGEWFIENKLKYVKVEPKSKYMGTWKPVIFFAGDFFLFRISNISCCSSLQSNSHSKEMKIKMCRYILSVFIRK